MEDTKRHFYVFYDYLVFFWNKRSILLLIPVLLLIAGLLISFLIPTVYEGKAEFYVGEKLGDSVGDPKVVTKMLQEKLPKEMQANLQATVPKFKHIQIHYQSNDQKAGEKVLKNVAKTFATHLSTLHEQKRSLLQQYIDLQKKRIQSLEETVKLYHDRLNKSNPTELQIMLQSEQELTALQEQVYLTKLDLYDYEQQKPKLTSPVSIEQITLQKKSPNYFANSLIGFLSGIIIAIFALIFWKYFEDAKASRKR